MRMVVFFLFELLVFFLFTLSYFGSTWPSFLDFRGFQPIHLINFILIKKFIDFLYRSLYIIDKLAEYLLIQN